MRIMNVVLVHKAWLIQQFPDNFPGQKHMEFDFATDGTVNG